MEVWEARVEEIGTKEWEEKLKKNVENKENGRTGG